jgi:hypothetical protein
MSDDGFRFVNRSIQPVANSIASVTGMPIAIVRQTLPPILRGAVVSL